MTPELSDIDRKLLLSLSWFPPDREIVGVKCRSLSLGSHHFVKTMGIRSLDPFAEMSMQEEVEELSAYTWLHSAEIEEINGCAWSGEWQGARGFEEEDESVLHEILTEWRAIRESILGLLVVTDFEIKPKPKSKHDKTPHDVCGVTRFAHQVATIMEATGYSRECVLWELPKWEANQIYHKTLRHNGVWTVPARERSAPDDFESFEPEWLSEEAGEDGEGGADE